MNNENTSDTNQAKALNKTDVIAGALISMTNFVFKTAQDYQFKDDCGFAYAIRKYASFLKLPLELKMFVRCDLNGEPMKEPTLLQKQSDSEHHRRYYATWLEAKEKLVFKGFEVKTKTAFNKGYDFVCDNNEIFYPFWYNPVTGWELSKGLKTVEDLVIFQPKLTDNVLSEYFS